MTTSCLCIAKHDAKIFEGITQLGLFHLLLKERSFALRVKSGVSSVFVYHITDYMLVSVKRCNRLALALGKETVRFTVLFSSHTVLFHRQAEQKPFSCSNTTHQSFTQRLCKTQGENPIPLPWAKDTIGYLKYPTCRQFHGILYSEALKKQEEARTFTAVARVSGSIGYLKAWYILSS